MTAALEPCPNPECGGGDAMAISKLAAARLLQGVAARIEGEGEDAESA